MGVNGEALQLHAIYNFYCKSCENFVSVQEVTLEFVSGTASHACCVWTCNEIESSYDKIIITIVPSYTRKNITRLLPLPLLLMLCTCNNTDGNKLVIFSGTALYYGDNYMIGYILCAYWTLQCFTACPKAFFSISSLLLPPSLSTLQVCIPPLLLGEASQAEAGEP